MNPISGSQQLFVSSGVLFVMIAGVGPWSSGRTEPVAVPEQVGTAPSS